MQDRPLDEATGDLLYSGEQGNLWLGAYLTSAGVSPSLISDVHRADEMFAYALSASHNSWNDALVLYHQCGLMAWRMVQQLLGLATCKNQRWLDFGCGYGRVLRFAVAETAGLENSDLDITGCEIDERAVEFVSDRLGVTGLVSSHKPEDFGASLGAFSLVTAQSVFSHLPEATFKRWLEELWKRVAPGGVLAISTNDIGSMPEGLGDGVAEFLFERHSESDSLAEDLYGTTWLSSGWMKSTIQSVAQGELAFVECLPKGLWNAQDVWVIAKVASPARGDSPPPGITGNADFQNDSGHAIRGTELNLETAVSDPVWRPLYPVPLGYLDGVELLGPHRVKVEGWCLAAPVVGQAGPELAPQKDAQIDAQLGAQIGTQLGDSVRVEILRANGELLASCSPQLKQRQDLEQEFGDRFTGGGWSVTLEVDEPLSGVEFLRVMVGDWPVHLSLLDAADRRVRVERQIHELEVGLRIVKTDLERKGGLPLRFARAIARRLAARRSVRG